MQDSESQSGASAREEALRRAREYRRRGYVVVNGYRFRVEDVNVTERHGYASGWDILIRGDPGSYAVYMASSPDSDVVRYVVTRRGAVVEAVAVEGDRARVTITYY